MVLTTEGFSEEIFRRGREISDGNNKYISTEAFQSFS